MLRLAVLATTLASVLAGAGTAAAGPVASIVADHVGAEIVLRNAVTAPGEAVDVAIRHRLDEGWHTYWINPGDSGEPPIVEWTSDATSEPFDGPLRFPAPSLVPYPPLMNHGYSDGFTLLTDLTVPADWPAGEPWPVTARIDWLVCSDICIPEGGTATFSVPTGPASEVDSTVGFTFVQAEWALPKTVDAAATYVRGDDGTITLTFDGTPAGGEPRFFAYDRALLDHAADQPVTVTDGTSTLTLASVGGTLDGTLSGVLVGADGAVEITATGPPDAAPAPAFAAAPPPAGPIADEVAPAAVTAPRPAIGVWHAVALAFLGGLVLNLMPCVFPVLAVKAMGLVAHANAPLSRRATIGGAYAAGVLASLAVVVVALFALRGAGEAVGWGFQLQSPAFVAVMTVVVFAFGLNLSGLFEVGTGLTGLSGGGRGSGAAGSFSAGLLATVVATPCTAPFMATAMGAALVAEPAYAALVFLALGVGLALPFVALAIVPGGARLLPRPGLWMLRLKQALAFPLYLTAAWLLWVLAQLVPVDALLPVLAGLVLVALAAWLWGLSQRGSAPSHRVATGLALASAAAAVVALSPVAGGAASLGVRPALASAEGIAEPFTPDRLSALQAQGRPVFVNVTAAWCITCKVNERVALSGAAFEAALRDNDITYLKADWTRRDPDVTRLIERFGRAGVPLYVYFPATGEPTVLPQILSSTALEIAFAES